MLTSRKQTSTVGVDIETGSVAATEVAVNGAPRLGRSGIVPLAHGVMRDGEVLDPDALGAALKDLFAGYKLPRNVRVGIANQRVVVRTLRLPLIENHDELETAIRFQAAEQIPMPLEQAVLDWRVAESEPAVREARQMDVVVVAARREAVAGFTSALRAAGLKAVGIDISSFAMIRALAGELPTAQGPVLSYEERADLGEPEPDGAAGPGPARLYCNLGDVTNLAVARGASCLFARISPFGMDGIAQRLAERRGLTLDHARQWLVHVGMRQPIAEVDGDPLIVRETRDVLEEGASRLAGELRVSLDFYGSQESAVAVEEIVVCGSGTSVAGLPERLERELGYAMRVGRPSALSGLDEQTAARLTLPYGLALED